MFHLCKPMPTTAKVGFLLEEIIMWHLVFTKLPDFSKAHMLTYRYGVGTTGHKLLFGGLLCLFPIWIDFLTTSGRWNSVVEDCSQLLFLSWQHTIERELPSYVTDVAASPAFACISLRPFCTFLPGRWFVEPHNLHSVLLSPITHMLSVLLVNGLCQVTDSRAVLE
jgi:hypothetical protein